jgi:hypothetical protein
MKRLLTILMLLAAVTLQAQSVTLAWNASGSPEVTGYRIYYGTNSRSYAFVTNTALVTTQTVVLPRLGRWFFAATAHDAQGLESEYSNEVEWEAKPGSPVLQGELFVRLSPVIERSTNLVDWVNTTGAPTFFAATNGAEFFATRGLIIEKVQRALTP